MPERSVSLPGRVDVLVIGAGVIGTTIATRLLGHGVDVCVVDERWPAGGSSSAGEGNILVSDKLPGPDLLLALRSAALWRERGAELGERIEYEPKGGLVVARTGDELERLSSLARSQEAGGACVELLGADDLRSFEPGISQTLAGGVFYSDDAQVQPMKVVDVNVAQIRRRGGRVLSGVEVIGAERDANGAIVGVWTSAGHVAVSVRVVNAAGPWSGEVAKRLGATLPVTARRGHVLVSEPVEPITCHKVYESGYVDDIHGNQLGWTASAVVESTAAGTMLLGSSREFVGFSRTVNPAIVATIASRSITLFPSLAGVRLIRTYVGFRPASPDGLPILGEDPAIGRLVHASGHEGAGIGLAEVSGEIIEDLLLDRPSRIDTGPYSPKRFSADAGVQ